MRELSLEWVQRVGETSVRDSFRTCLKCLLKSNGKPVEVGLPIRDAPGLSQQCRERSPPARRGLTASLAGPALKCLIVQNLTLG